LEALRGRTVALLLFLLFLLPTTASSGKYFTIKGDEMLDMCYECGECIRISDSSARDECLQECVIRQLLAIINPLCKELCGGDNFCTKLCTRIECVKCALEPEDKIKSCLIRCLGKPLCDIILKPPCQYAISSWIPRVRTDECVEIGCGCLDCFITDSGSGGDSKESNCWIEHCIGDLILSEICEDIMGCEAPCRSNNELLFNVCKNCGQCLLTLIPGTGSAKTSKERREAFNKCLISKCMCKSLAAPLLGEVCENMMEGIFSFIPQKKALQVQVEYECNALVDQCCECITVDGKQERINCFMACGVRALIIGPMCAGICTGGDALIQKVSDQPVDIDQASCLDICYKCGECINEGFYYDVKQKKFIWDGEQILNCTITCILQYKVCPLIVNNFMCKNMKDNVSFMGVEINPDNCEDRGAFICQNCAYCLLAKPQGDESWGEAVGRCLLMNCLGGAVCTIACENFADVAFGDSNLFGGDIHVGWQQDSRHEDYDPESGVTTVTETYTEVSIADPSCEPSMKVGVCTDLCQKCTFCFFGPKEERTTCLQKCAFELGCKIACHTPIGCAVDALGDKLDSLVQTVLPATKNPCTGKADGDRCSKEGICFQSRCMKLADYNYQECAGKYQAVEDKCTMLTSGHACRTSSGAEGVCMEGVQAGLSSGVEVGAYCKVLTQSDCGKSGTSGMTCTASGGQKGVCTEKNGKWNCEVATGGGTTCYRSKGTCLMLPNTPSECKGKKPPEYCKRMFGGGLACVRRAKKIPITCKAPNSEGRSCTDPEKSGSSGFCFGGECHYGKSSGCTYKDPKTKKTKDAPDGYLCETTGHVCLKGKCMEMAGNGREECAVAQQREERGRKVWCSAGNGVCVYPGGRPPACIAHTMKVPAVCKQDGSDGKVCFDDLTTQRGICMSGECLIELTPNCADYSNNLKMKSCYDVCDACVACYDIEEKEKRSNCLKGCWNPLEIPCLTVCQDQLGLSGQELTRCVATCVVCQGCPYGCNGDMEPAQLTECIVGCLFHKSGIIITNICEELEANAGIDIGACLGCTKCLWAGGARKVRECLVNEGCINALDICQASCSWVCQGETSGPCFDQCCECTQCLFKDTKRSRDRCFLDCVCPPLITGLCDQVCEGRSDGTYESCKEVCMGCGMCCRRPAGDRLTCLAGCIGAQALYIECDAFCSNFPNPLTCITCCRSNVQCAGKEGEEIKECLLEGTKDCVNGILFDICQELCDGEPGCMEVCQKCTMCPLTSPDLKQCVAMCIDDLAVEITNGICDAVCFSAYDKGACMDDCQGCKTQCAFVEDVAARLACFEGCDKSGDSKLKAILALYGIRMTCTALFAPGGVGAQLTGGGGSWGQMGAELAGEAVCMAFCLSGVACDVKFMKHFIACPEKAHPNLYIYYNTAVKYYENAIIFYDNILRNLVVIEVGMGVQTGFCVFAQGKELLQHGIGEMCLFGIPLYAPYPPMAGSVWWNSCTVCWISSLASMLIPVQCQINKPFSSPIGIPFQIPTWSVAKECGKRTGVVDDICSVEPDLFSIGDTHDPMTYTFKVNQLTKYTNELVKDGGILKTGLMWVKKLREKARTCTVSGSCDNDIRQELEGLKASWQAADSVDVGKGSLSGGSESWSLEVYEEKLDEMSMWTKAFYSDASRSSSLEMIINRACSWNQFKEDDISPDYEKYIWRYGIITRCALYNLKTSAPGDFMWHDTDCLFYTAASDALEGPYDESEEELPIEGEEEIDEECLDVRDGRQCMFGICCEESCETVASCCELREDESQCNTISGKHGICCEGWCTADRESCEEVIEEEEDCIEDGDECSDGDGLCCNGRCFLERASCEGEEEEICAGNAGVACDEGRGLCCDGSCVYDLEECPDGEVPVDDTCSPLCLQEHGTDGYCQPSRKRCACRTGLFPLVLEDARCEPALSEDTIDRLEDYCDEQDSGEVDECHTATSSSGYCCQGVLEEVPIGNEVVVSKRPRPSISKLEWLDADGEAVRVAKVGEKLTLRAELTDRLDPLTNGELELTVRTSTQIVLSRTIPDISISPDTRRHVSIELEVTTAIQNEVLLADAVLIFAGNRVESEDRPRVFVPEPNTISVMDAAFFVNDQRSTDAYPGDSLEAILEVVSSYSGTKQVSIIANLAEFQGSDLSGTFNNDYPALEPYKPVAIKTGMLGSIGTYMAGGFINVTVLIKDRNDPSLIYAEIVLDTSRFPELALVVHNPYLTLTGIDFADSGGRMTESVFDGEDVTVRAKLQNDMGTNFLGNIEMIIRDTDLSTVHREVFTNVEVLRGDDETLRTTFEARARRTTLETGGGGTLSLEPNDHIVELNAIDVNSAEWLDTVARTWRLRASPGGGGEKKVRILSTTRYDQCRLAIECEGCNPECSVEIRSGCTAVFNLCTCDNCMFKPIE